MSELKAKKPDVTQKRLKMFLYGPPASGKTTNLIQFPNNYIVDMEHGTDNYAKTIIDSNSAVLHTVNPDEISEQLQLLLTTKHEYKTVSIDPVTHLYNAEQEKWTRVFTQYAANEKAAALQDFGPRYWGRVKSAMKSIDRKLLALDMNVILTSHQKDVYGSNMNKLGVSFDAIKGIDYLFDYVFRLEKVDGKYLAFTMKERAEVGKARFPEQFEWSYANFQKFYGADILEREAKPVEMATPADVQKLKELLEIVKVDDETVQRWLTKADADTFDEFNKDQITKCINFLKDKLPK